MTLDRKVQLLTKRFLDTRDAYVTGYFYATVDSIPSGFVKFMKSTYNGNWNEDKIIEVFTNMATDIKLPQETLKTVTVPGRAGFSRTSPLFSEKSNSITITFLVDQNLESTTLFSGWHDYITRVADGRLDAGSDVSRTNIFGCNFYYCTLLPNMRDIVFAFAGEGLFPTNNPVGDFGHAAGTTEGMNHSMSFNIDYYDTWVVGKKPMFWLKEQLRLKIEEALGIEPEPDAAPTHYASVFDNAQTPTNDGSVHDKYVLRSSIAPEKAPTDNSQVLV